MNAILPLLDYQNCDKRQPSDYYRRRDPCGMPTRTWAPFEVEGRALYYFLLALHTNSCINVCYTVLSVTMTLVGEVTLFMWMETGENTVAILEIDFVYYF